MARFNKKQTIVTTPADTTNYEGAPAFKMDDKTTLYTQVCACLWGEPSFYDATGERESNIITLIHKIGATDPEWLMKLAVYARETMHLRSVPVVILAEMAAHKEYKDKPKPWIVKWGERIIPRADEMGELLAYYTSKFGKKIPNSIKNVIEKRLLSLSEYDVSKYAGNKGWKMHDIVNYIHPKPLNEKQEMLFGYIVGKNKADEKTLPLLYARDEFLKKTELDEEALGLIQKGSITWETAISKFGNNANVWDALDIPIMASIRNIRNIVNSEASLDPVISKLNDANIVRKSKMFPYRFWQAYKIVCEMFMQTSKIGMALDNALAVSSTIIDKLDGKSLICIDHSGSMDSDGVNYIRNTSQTTLFEKACVLGVAASFISPNNDIYLFGETTKKANVLNNKHSTFINRMNLLQQIDVGHSTLAHLPIDVAVTGNAFYDRIFVFSDMQCYAHKYNTSLYDSIKEYRKKVNKNVRVISVDLAGHGTSQVSYKESNTLLLSGFSENLFRLVQSWEQSSRDAVEMISQLK
ncbi:MAG: TROVE domain protein [Firmicutes bacterium ADurb.Bin419]|nr:MAG: TROVE domain protein [Firmicutes bacterium ADurb.Bin419]